MNATLPCPCQERLPYSGLMWRFLWEYHLTVLRWARWARTEVEAWPEDLSRLDATTEFRKVVSAAVSLPDGTWQPEPRRRKGNPPLHSV